MNPTKDGRASYACGEEPPKQKIKTRISIYKYLVYFVILDSSVVLLAFASLALDTANLVLVTLYLVMLFFSCALWMGGE